MTERGNTMIEPAAIEELQEILQLQYLAYQTEAALFGTQDIPPLKQTLDEVIAECKSGIILKLTENGTVYIGKLMVHPDYRRRGYGSALLSAIEQQFPGRRYELFTSTRSADNLRLYRKAGYTEFARRAVSGELVFVYLEKR